jgi:hypothetical protein
MLAVLRNRVSEVNFKNAAVVLFSFWRIEDSEIFRGDFEADALF